MIGPPIGHLGSRASALLDGRLDTHEAERAWEHVHGCHACRDLVEREAWVKQRLSRLSASGAGIGAPEGLKGSLIGRAHDAAGVRPHVTELVGARARVGGTASHHPAHDVAHHRVHHGSHGRRSPIAVVGGGAVGAAVLGVLALGAAPAQAPTGPSLDRRTPVAQLGPTAPLGSSSSSAFSPIGDRTRVPRP